jgi:hypothetical protein
VVLRGISLFEECKEVSFGKFIERKKGGTVGVHRQDVVD